MMQRLIAGLFICLLLSPMAASAAIVDCAKLADIDKKKTYDADDRDIRACLERGWDPPKAWKANRIHRVITGASGITFGGRQAPEMPPGRANAKASVSAALLDFTLNFPPWRGFPCQLPGGSKSNMCGKDDATAPPSNGNGISCAIATAASSANNSNFGSIKAIDASGSLSLPCGAAAPLSTYLMQMTTAPTAILATEAGSRTVWLYYKSGNGYVQVASKPLPYWRRCVRNEYGRIESRELVRPPIAQIITFNASSTHVTLRLMRSKADYNPTSEEEIKKRYENTTEDSTPIDESEFAKDRESVTDPSSVLDPFDPDPELKPDDYLTIPLHGGTPDIPDNCDDSLNQYATINALTSPLTVESAVSEGGSRITESECGLEPGQEYPSTEEGMKALQEKCASSSPSRAASASCDVVTLTPSSARCTGQMQFAALSRPNLIYASDSTASFQSMQGRTAYLATAPADSRLYAKAESLMYFGREGGPFVLPEGGTLKMDAGNKLIMNGPATINAAAGTITLTNGGNIQSMGGTLLKSFPSGTVYSTGSIPLPYVVKVGRSVNMPEGMAMPTQPPAVLRLPIATK